MTGIAQVFLFKNELNTPFLFPICNLANTSFIVFAGMFSFVLAFTFFIFIFYRIKRETVLRQQKADLLLQVSEMEMKALRAQMDPHFIFNSLTSVYRFMENNDVKSASNYLLKMASMVRQILENSRTREVAIEDDLIALKLYIDLERMRLNFSFDYTVTVDDNIDISSFAVPPLLIQPFIENAIWHGLKNRLEGGHLIIYIKKDVNCITYVVEDNGCIVKETATSILAGNIKKTSMGQGIVQGRLDVLNKINRTNVAGYKMEPQFDSAGCYVGSRTTVTIPLLEI